MGILNKKIPSILGVLIITIGIAVTTFLVKGEKAFKVNAGPGQTPKNIQVSNISDTSFTVTYTTDDSVIGSINVGENPKKLDIKYLDNRDKGTGAVKEYYTHIITVNGLRPNSNYFYSITSGAKTYYNNKTAYTANTSFQLDESSSIQNEISGKVINSDGTNPTDGIIIIKINGAQVLSTTVNSDGRYNYAIKNLKTFNLERLFELRDKNPVNIDIFVGNQISKVQIFSDQLYDIPTVIASNNYDFLELNSNNVIDTKQNVKFPEFKSKIKSKSIKTKPETRTMTPTNIPTTN